MGIIFLFASRSSSFNLVAHWARLLYVLSSPTFSSLVAAHSDNLERYGALEETVKDSTHT